MKVVAFDVDLDFVLGGVAVFDIVFAFVVVLFLSLSSFLSNVLVILFCLCPPPHRSSSSCRDQSESCATRPIAELGSVS